MMRVTSCCCGCSLRTGTLIILWLDLLCSASNIINLIVEVSQPTHLTFLHSSLLTWSLISLVTVIYAIAGVEKHRPSYMLPYIGLCIAGMVFLVIGFIILWIGSIALRDYIVDGLTTRFKLGMSSSLPKYATQDDHYAKARAEDGFNVVLSLCIVYFVLMFAISYYLCSVVYSYYRQMQDEDKGIHRGTGIVYATPAAAPTNGFNDCPPVYGQQPAYYVPQNTGPPPNASYPQQYIQYPQQSPAYPPLVEQKQ